MKHIALFSQTGSEIVGLMANGFKPDYVFYDQTDEDKINSHIDLNNSARILKRNVKNVQHLRDCFGDPKKCFITLHGWLNILPKEICREYNVYNGHPGYIIDYPELKGKDPQARAFLSKERYRFIGCVLHKVIPEVDEGEILLSKRLPNVYDSVEGIIEACARISLSLWIDFLTAKKVNE
jgi:folate-dependent phosphoribosylglycinamide formyltransferase PurN